MGIFYTSRNMKEGNNHFKSSEYMTHVVQMDVQYGLGHRYPWAVVVTVVRGILTVSGDHI